MEFWLGYQERELIALALEALSGEKALLQEGALPSGKIMLTAELDTGSRFKSTES